MGFKRSVLITALIVFIVMLLIMAVVIKNSYENVVYPPEIFKLSRLLGSK